MSKLNNHWAFKWIRAIFIKDKAVSLIILIGVCVLVYFPTFNNRFQNFWDDTWVVVNYYTEGGLNWINVHKILTEFYHGQYAPVNQLYYLLLFNCVGYYPAWFHGWSLAIHIGNVLLIFFFVSKLLTLNKGFEPASVQRIAFFTALLFAIHPFLVEAVAWISASKVVLYAFFYLLALLCYLKYTTALQLRYYFVALVFFIISFGAKEQAVTLPLCLLLIDYTLNRNLKDWQLWLEKIPFIILSILFGIVTMFSQAATGAGALSKTAPYPYYQKIAFSAYSLIEYLLKCLIPYKLSYLYPFPNTVGTAMPARFWIYPFVVVFVLIFLWRFWKKRWIFFGMSFFIIHLAVALHIITISRFAIVADRYVYIASIGIFFILAWLFDSMFRLKYKYRNAIAGCSLIYLLILGTYTNNRVKDWYNTDTLKKEIRQILKQRKDYHPNR